MLRSPLRVGYALVVFSWTGLAAQAAKPPTAASAPTITSYHVSFERREAVQGVSSSQAIALPFQCTTDGTIFVNFASPGPANVVPPPPPSFNLVSISQSGVSHTFALEQVPDLYSVSVTGHYAYDSGVAFLVRATRNSKLQENPGETAAERAAARHTYVIIFDRDGKYQRTIALDDGLHIHRLAVFPSGAFLVYGYDSKDHTAKLVMLKDDGIYLKSLDVPAGAISVEAKGSDDTKRGPILAAEFVRADASIMVLQQQGNLPILEVSQGGNVRIFRPKIPADGEVVDLIPSDQNLFAVVDGKDKSAKGVIYELRPQDGSVQRTFTLDDPRDAEAVACIHEGKFLSIDYNDGRVTPLIGTPESSR